eukprot:1033225-Pyramimonas_sp.AAC.1
MRQSTSGDATAHYANLNQDLTCALSDGMFKLRGMGIGSRRGYAAGLFLRLSWGTEPWPPLTWMSRTGGCAS